MFRDDSVARVYPKRPAYPAALFRRLRALMVDDGGPATALDIGAGTGEIAREFCTLVDGVDAADFSAAMVARGRALPGGEDPRIAWTVSAVEEIEPARLAHAPYALAIAAASLHWMDWDVTLPLIARLLRPAARLVLVDNVNPPKPWNAEIAPVIARYSLNKDFERYSMASVAETLAAAGLFAREGDALTEIVSFTQTPADWIDALHARNGFSRDRMGEEEAAELDELLAQILGAHTEDGLLDLSFATRLIWGRPLDPAAQP